MQGIISVIIIITLIVAFLLWLLLIGANKNKTEEEIENEKREEYNYFNKYSKLYSWDEVKAYSIIALHNLLHSANEVNITNIDIFIDPLRDLYDDDVVEYAKKILSEDKKSKK